MAKTGNRVRVVLRSTESGHNYYTFKNRQNNPDRLEIKKYDPTQKKHVLYREDR